MSMEALQPLSLREKILGYLLIASGILSVFQNFRLDLLLGPVAMRAASGFGALLGIGLLRRWRWARVCALALLWPFLIVLPLLILAAISSPSAFYLTLSWDGRPLAEARSPLLIAVVVTVSCLALWLAALWVYRGLARVRELDGRRYWQVVLRWALVGFVAAFLLGAFLSLLHKQMGIPKEIVAGFLTPGMGCWQLLTSIMPVLEPLVQTKWSIICVSLFFTAVFASLLGGASATLNLKLKKTA